MDNKTDNYLNVNTFVNRKCWRPLILEYIKTNSTILIDVRVINPRNEVNLRWLEWVIGREVDIEEVDPT